MGAGLDWRGPTDDHVALIVLESFRYIDFERKLPLLMRSLEGEYQNRSVVRRLLRCGPNSIPNRCPLLTGRPVLHARACRPRDGDYLDTVANVLGYSTFVGEVRNRKNDFTYMERILFGSPGNWRNSRLVADEWCPVEPGCPIMPEHRTPTLASACGDKSMYDVVFRGLERHVAERGPTFSISNFYEFHPPHLEYGSPDLDNALNAVLQTFPKATVFILGDHGHGLGDGGEAGLVVRLGPRAQRLSCIREPGVVTTRTVHRMIKSVLYGDCNYEPTELTWETELVDPVLLPRSALPPRVACRANTIIAASSASLPSVMDKLSVVGNECYGEPGSESVVETHLRATCGTTVDMTLRVTCSGVLPPSWSRRIRTIRSFTALNGVPISASSRPTRARLV